MTKKQPEISVIIPVYNYAEYITDAIVSVIEQTFTDLEIIVVDDGSTDGSAETAERILINADFPYKIVTKPNEGNGAARNTGIDLCSGKWIYFLDADDFLHPDALNTLINAVNDTCIDISFYCYCNVFSRTVKYDKIATPTVTKYSRDEIEVLFLKRKVLVNVCSALYPADLLKNEVRFNNIRFSEDQYFIWELLTHISNAVYINAPYYYYYRHSGSIMTASKKDAIISAYYAFKEHPTISKSPLLTRFMLSRWVFGSIRTGAKILDYSDWIDVCNKTEAQKHMNNLLSFPDLRVRIAAFLFTISKKIFYKLTI